MPNLELYFMRYYVLKNCDIFTKLILNLAPILNHTLTGRKVCITHPRVGGV